MTDYNEAIHVSWAGDHTVTLVLECTDARKAESVAHRINSELLDRSKVTLTLKKRRRAAKASREIAAQIDCRTRRDE